MSYKLSVIIPCYNAEKTIERAINSVINQSLGFENIELLLYDDASTDSTPFIIEKFAKIYSNVVAILSKENSGRPSKGRNECIKRASSEFLMFMDNDDEFDVEICKNLYHEIVSTNSELVTCNFINIMGLKESKYVCEHVFEKAVSEENKLIFFKPNIFYFNNIYVWNSIFRRDIAVSNKIFFPEDEFAEDVFFSQNYKLFVSKLVYLKDYFGVYRHVQQDSLSNSFDFHDLKDIHESQLELYDKLKNFDVPLDYIFKNHISMTLIRLSKSDSLNYSNRDLVDFLKKIRDFEVELNGNYLFGGVISIVNYFLIKENYNCVIFMLKLLRFAFNSKILRKIYYIFK